MKKITLSALLFFGLHYAFGQLPVSRTAENKNVVLEEFTGIHCGHCPDGHKRAQQIQDAHPDDVVLINIHTGGYANPGSGEPDFRTQFGSAIASQSQLAGYPAGTVNRHYFGHSQYSSPSGATALGRGQWAGDANTILGQSSYCNIALEANIDVQTREITVNVEVYYTGNAPVSSNYINIALLQDNVEGPQSGAAANPSQVLPNGKYNHLHMLRHLITGQWGDEITTVRQGTLVQRQYTYHIPESINDVDVELGNLQIVGFVTQTHQEIITGNKGTITLTNYQYSLNADAYKIINNDFFCNSGDLNPKIAVRNKGAQDITGLTFEYNVNNGANQTHTWSGNISSFTSKIIELPDISFSVEPTNTLQVNITSINGNNTDDNAADNTQSANFSKTTNQGVGTDYVVTINQDRYGSEITWRITDDAGNIIAHDGPYTDLSSSGTLARTHNVTITTSGCYKFQIMDSYGDGMCCRYGSGSYQLAQSDGTIVFQGDGNYTTQKDEPFTIETSNSIEEASFGLINIYPNPSEGTIIVENAEEMQLQIFDLNGSLVYQQNNLTTNENIHLNLSNGIYMAKFIKNDSVATRKIVITK